jgi:hypothetical protein
MRCSSVWQAWVDQRCARYSVRPQDESGELDRRSNPRRTRLLSRIRGPDLDLPVQSIPAFSRCGGVNASTSGLVTSRALESTTGSDRAVPASGRRGILNTNPSATDCLTARQPKDIVTKISSSSGRHPGQPGVVNVHLRMAIGLRGALMIVMGSRAGALPAARAWLREHGCASMAARAWLREHDTDRLSIFQWFTPPRNDHVMRNTRSVPPLPRGRDQISSAYLQIIA